MSARGKIDYVAFVRNSTVAIAFMMVLSNVFAKTGHSLAAKLFIRASQTNATSAPKKFLEEIRSENREYTPSLVT